MQKPKFDLRRLRDLRVQDLRDRAGRLRQIQALGSQVTRLRQRRIRSEYLVPLAALLLLVLALIVSRGPDGPLVADRDNLGDNPEIIDATTIVTGTALGDGYSLPSTVAGLRGSRTPTVTPVLVGTGSLTGTDGYPGPDETGGPVPLGTPAAGGLSPDDSAFPPSFGGGIPTPPGGSFAPPALITPIVPGNSGSSTSGYPPPSSFDSNNPSPGTLPGPALLPTSAPFVPVQPPSRSVTRPPAVPSREQPLTSGITTIPTPRSTGGSTTGTVPGAPGSGYPSPPTSSGSAPTAPPAQAGQATQAPAGVVPGVPAPATGDAQPTAVPEPTVPPTPVPPTATPVPPTPTPEPITRIDGHVRWSADQSPYPVDQDMVIAPGATLQIDPGVEVRLKPGVDIFVEGQLRVMGNSGAPVRFGGPEGRWNSITGQPGSFVTIEQAQLRNAGGGGIAISSTGGLLSLREVLLTEGGGGITSSGSTVDLRGVQIYGNDLPYGPAIDLRLGRETPATIHRSIVGGNRVSEGTPQVRLIAGGQGAGPLDIQGNAFSGDVGPLLTLETAAPIGGTVRCNGFRNGAVGLQLSASTPSAQDFALVVDNNAFEGQSSYGVASTVALDAGSNWWGDPSGPADAQRNSGGRGVRVGVNVGFQPVLPARPECAPIP